MQLSGIDLNLLPVLHALLEESSVTRAAARVGLSVSATSHALNRLRLQLDDPLLVRAGRTLKRTPRAEALLPSVQRAVETATRVFEPPASIDLAAIRRRLVLQTTDHVSFVLLHPLEARLAREAPGIDLDVRPIEPDITEPLRSGRLDLAVGVWSELPADVEHQPLFEDRFVVVMRADHPAAHGHLDLHTYAALDHVLVSPRGRPGGLIDELLAPHGLQRRVIRTTPSFFAAAFLVAQTDYVLTMSRRMATALSSTLPLRVLEPPLETPTYTLQAAWHRARRQDPVLAWLRNRLLEAGKDLR